MHGFVDLKQVFRITGFYTAFENRYGSNYYFDGENHNFWEIVIVMEGEIGVTAGSDVYLLKKGQAIIHEPMEFHRLWSEGNTCPHIIIFSFDAENMPEFTSKIFEIQDKTKAVEILFEMKEKFEIDGGNVKAVKESSQVLYQLTLKKLESFILTALSQKAKKGRVLKSRMAENYTNIVTVLEKNINKNMSVAEIADMCNMSEINLKKTFSKYAGMGVMNYFNQVKITAAKSMLKEGLTVKETAEKLGFSNQNYFSTVFKRVTGKAPSSCR